MPPIKPNIGTKTDFASRPSVPSSQKENASEFNLIVAAIRANYERLILRWATDISANEVLPVGQYVVFTDDVIYRIHTSYNVGSPITWDASKATAISGSGGGGTGFAIEATYTDGTAMFADQAAQVTNAWYMVQDASIGDPSVLAGWAIYQYLGTTNGDITDYLKIAEQESLDIIINNASETVKGIVEEATDAEVSGGVDTGATGARLYVNPAKLLTYLATVIPGAWSTTTAGKVEESDTTESENIAVQAVVGGTVGLSHSRTPSEVGLKEMLRFFYGLSLTWVSPQTFTSAPVFSSATADRLMTTNGSKTLASLEYANLLPKMYAVASGTNTYAASLTPSLTAYAIGQIVFINFTNAQTSTTPTLNINSLGAKTIVKRNSTALESGDIAAGQIYALIYDGTNFRLMGVANHAVLEGVTVNGLTASLPVITDSNKKLASGAYATQAEMITGTDAVKFATPQNVEKKRSVLLTSVSNSATGTNNIDCDNKQEVTVYFNTTITGGNTITVSNASNLEILHIVMPVTGSNIGVTFPSTTRMARVHEVSSGDGWYESTKIFQLSSVGTADTHEFSLKRVSTGPTYNLRYDGPYRA